MDSLTKNWEKHDFTYFSQEFDNNVLDITEQKWFYNYGYSADFEKFKENYLTKKSFIVR